MRFLQAINSELSVRIVYHHSRRTGGTIIRRYYKKKDVLRASLNKLFNVY